MISDFYHNSLIHFLLLQLGVEMLFGAKKKLNHSYVGMVARDLKPSITS